MTELGHRVLDLNPGIQLEEEEVAALEHELGRARADVADRAREALGGVAEARAQLCVDRGRRRLLEHLLVPPLDRAFPLAQRDDVAVPVGKQLDLDVARTFEIALEVDAVVPEADRASR